MEVELNDDLDKACKPALGLFCSENEMGVGTEFLCLQEHFDDLIKEADQHPEAHSDCLEQLTGLTEIASEELDLEQVLFQACEPMVQKFCSQVIQQEDEGQVLGCLIAHKDSPEMNQKCQAGVYHFQIISLENYRLSFAFYKACKTDIREHCAMDPDKKHKKTEIIKCLSTEMRDSVLSDRPNSLSPECQEEVTFELLGEFGDIKLNPKLAEACQYEVRNLCMNSKGSF